MKPYLWQFFLFTLAGWINRVQQDAIEYLKEETQRATRTESAPRL